MTPESKLDAALEDVELPPVHAYEDEPPTRSNGANRPAVLDELPEPDAPTIHLRHLSEIIAERREPEWLRRHIVEMRVLAVVAGARGTFKSFIGLDWIMHAAVAGHAGVILSGEGAGLDRRADAWLRTHAPNIDAKALPVLALERPLNLNAPAELKALRGAMRASGINPAAVMVDTFSKFAPGLDENDNAEVSAFLAELASGLRDEFDCTVLLVAHSGHADPRRPRGASVLMCNPDAEYVVQRPDPTAMTVTVTRERFKDSPALPALAYAAEVVDLGRVDRYGDPVTSLALRETECAPPARPELRGRAQRQLLAALRAKEPGSIWTLADMREVGRQAGLSKATARSAAEALTFCAWTKATVGGWSLADE